MVSKIYQGRNKPKLVEGIICILYPFLYSVSDTCVKRMFRLTCIIV